MRCDTNKNKNIVVDYLLRHDFKSMGFGGTVFGFII
jgi:hypothetical protein